MSRRAWGAFAAVSVLWGLPYLFIKIADDGGMPPLLLAWSRVVLGAAVLLTVAARKGTLSSLRDRGPWLVAFAFAEVAVPFPMIAIGEQHVASSTAAILIATVPLIIALLNLHFDPAERVTGRRFAGLLVGLAGVAALVGIDISGGSGELLGVGAVLIAACGYATGALILKGTSAISTRPRRWVPAWRSPPRSSPRSRRSRRPAPRPAMARSPRSSSSASSAPRSHSS